MQEHPFQVFVLRPLGGQSLQRREGPLSYVNKHLQGIFGQSFYLDQII